ncbi:MAG: ligase-associated DNA damage response endonuclease PdeM [Candidatus Cloacimonetes bacterium]|nr:ligase-associated DNA damage response endonuclease PdeM [Candidatus Cloacimonadota bacterium]
MTRGRSADVLVRGQTLTLHPERAVYWERARTLIVADTHFGKAATFRAHGLPVPVGTTTAALQRLDAVLTRTRAERLLFLGDFLHARAGRAAATLAALEQWRFRHGRIEMVLVRGNHDREAGDPPAALGIECVDEPMIEAPFVFAHHPAESTFGYVIAGHVHPGITLWGRARMRERLPCFWFGRATAVLPAFGEFTGSAQVTPTAGDGVYVIAGDDVLSIDGVADGR